MAPHAVGNSLSNGQAVEQLARSLNRAQRRLDPDGFAAWSEYDERDKDFFRSTVRSLLLDWPLWLRAHNSDDDLVDGRAVNAEQLDVGNHSHG